MKQTVHPPIYAHLSNLQAGFINVVILSLGSKFWIAADCNLTLSSARGNQF